MEKCEGGSRGCTPWGASPSGGARGSLSYSLVKTLLPSQKSDEFLHPDRIKNNAFFCPVFLNRPHSEKPLRAWKRILPSFILEMLTRIVEIPCFSFKE
jgi:hypothetical protein